MTNAKLISHDDEEEIVFDPMESEAKHQTDFDTSLESLISDMNDDSDKVSMSIVKQSGNGQQPMQFVEALPVDKYDFIQLQQYIGDTYGGGDYRVQVRAQGRRGMVINKLISIAPKVVKKVSNESGSGIEHTLGLMMQQQNAMFQKLMESMTQVKSLPQPEPPNEDQMIDRMLKYKALFGGGGETQQMDGLTQLMNAKEALTSFGIQVGGELPEKEEGFTDILKSALPSIAEAIASNRPQQSQQQPQQPISEKQKMINIEKMKLKMGLKTLLSAAKKGADTSNFAQMITATYDEDIIRANISVENGFERACMVLPEIEGYKEWFDDLKIHIEKIYELNSDESSVINGESTSDEGYRG